MDPGTGNVYTREQARLLGLDLDKLIELEPEEVDRILAERVAEAEALAKEIGARAFEPAVTEDLVDSKRSARFRSQRIQKQRKARRKAVKHARRKNR